MVSRVKGQISKVPYAEPSWLSEGFSSPYYKEVCVSVALSSRSSRGIAEPSKATEGSTGIRG